VATYQSVSGAGAGAIEALRGEAPDEHRLRMDWDYDGTEFDEEVKLREETRKILELPDLPVSASCVRVPVVVGHAESVWIETQEPLSEEDAAIALTASPSVCVAAIPAHEDALGADHVLVGRIRRDRTSENGLVLFVICDNLRKGAALNAIQVAELAVDVTTSAARA
jgi:aspartate-semialdehyde dehydrogenase